MSDTHSLVVCVRAALQDATGPGDARYLYPEAWDALTALATEYEWHRETFPTGEGSTELAKARSGVGLSVDEMLPALRAAMEVADAAKRRGIAAELALAARSPSRTEREAE